MKILLLSDIHGNLSALNAVLEDAKQSIANCGSNFDGLVLLGDNIDYGMRSNEVVEVFMDIDIPILCSLWGNHENAILNRDFSKFSSNRGQACAQNTAKHINDASRLWLVENADSAGEVLFDIDDKRVYAVHGSKGDPLWGKITPGQSDYSEYADFDVVLSGHTHVPHVFTIFLPCEDERMRNKKTVVFVNPGSVGQPRNHDPHASYAIWDTEGQIKLCTVPYDIVFEQSLYDGSVDSFYSDRLARGI